MSPGNYKTIRLSGVAGDLFDGMVAELESHERFMWEASASVVCEFLCWHLEQTTPPWSPLRLPSPNPPPDPNPDRIPEVGLMDGFTAATVLGRPPFGSRKSRKSFAIGTSSKAERKLAEARMRLTENNGGRSHAVSYSVTIEFLIWHWERTQDQISPAKFSPETPQRGRPRLLLRPPHWSPSDGFVTPSEVRKFGDEKILKAGKEAFAAAQAAGLTTQACIVARLKAEDAMKAELASTAPVKLTGRLKRDRPPLRPRKPNRPRAQPID